MGKIVATGVDEQVYAASMKIREAKKITISTLIEQALYAWGIGSYQSAKNNLEFLKTMKPASGSAKEHEDMVAMFEREMELFRWFGEQSEADEAAQAVASEKALEEHKAKRGGKK